MRTIRYLLCSGLLLLTTGCSTYSLEELRSVAPRGTPFQAQLAMRYLEYSEEEAKSYDWIDSGYFADKGLQAAYGNDVAPENPERWDIQGEDLAVLQAARARLLSALAGRKADVPSHAADAQYYYDCWVENQDERGDEEAAHCKDNFLEAMSLLDGKPTAVSAETPPDTEAYIVFFGMDRAGLSEPAARIVEEIADNIKKHEENGYTIVVNGHTDTVGSERYNFDLSIQRAQSVLQALVDRGIPKSLIRAFGFGETDPEVRTPDQTPESENRRVEIYIGNK